MTSLIVQLSTNPLRQGLFAQTCDWAYNSKALTTLPVAIRDNGAEAAPE